MTNDQIEGALHQIEGAEEVTAVAHRMDNAVTRPLSVLVPLIKDAIRKGAEAYAEAGLLLREAKPQMAHGKYEKWVQDNFGVGVKQASVWVKLADATHGKQSSSRADYSSLADFQRKHLGQERRQTVYPSAAQKDWQEPVKESIEQARRQAERIAEANLSAVREREELNKLCLRAFDIGFKVLSKELHPDKGGSQDAMSRLNEARKLVKAKFA
jgi:hypothetical protein